MPLDPNSTTPNQSEETAPLWRKHFPVDTAEETSRSRRQFLGSASLAGGTMACSQAAFNSLLPQHKTNSTTTVESHSPLVLEKKLGDLEIGEALLFHYPNEKSPCLLVKLAEKEFVSFTQKCTHLACPVIPDMEHNEFHCPCHHGSFDLQSGEPKSGPPRSPLQSIEIEVAPDGTLTAVGMRH